MKRIFSMAALLLAVFATGSWSQKTEFGVKAGANFSTFTLNENVQDALGEAQTKVGFLLGLTVDIPFTSKLYTSDFYLMTGLELSQKGYKATQSYTLPGTVLTPPVQAQLNLAANPLYVQLPLYFAYKITVDKDVRFVPRAGPYLAYGLSGKLSYNSSVGAAGIDLSARFPELDLYGGNGILKNFDYGLGVGLGLEYSQFGLYLGYELGLANLADENTKKALTLGGEDYSIKTGNLYVSLGYRF
ncbi:hypothetical protein FACS1894181_10740 [Bacteroidia bacterium]|nr:hypothetical protein FACS1894181_10740 [Bacteroidia bacterium]